MQRSFVEAEENMLSNLTTFFNHGKKRKEKNNGLLGTVLKGSSKYYYKPNTSATFLTGRCHQTKYRNYLRQSLQISIP